MRQTPRFVQLSDQLIDSLRACFDSVDVNRTGFVHFDEICVRWRQFPPDIVGLLSPSFLETLARTVPPSGLVSFERFLAGVRISVVEQTSTRKPGDMKRVQSEGCNLHNLVEPPPLDHSNRDYMGSQPLYSNGRRNHLPMMGVNGNKPPPPYSGAVDSNENYCRVQLRQKKNGNASRGSSRASSGFRPISTNSTLSNCSSSMAEIRWRDSRMSNTPTPVDNSNRHSSYLPEHSHQVAKHETLLDEELDTTKKGIEKAQKLIEWYNKRMTTLDKRKEMLNKGMVALDSAVHEQKLNFLRAQVSELNRKIENLMASSEKGFPSHQNMIRNPVPASNGRISNNTTPEAISSVSLQRQNQRLIDELEAKSKLIEQLQREKRLYESQNIARGSYNPSPVNAVYVHSRATPTAYVKPALVHAVNGLPPSPVKIHDTLL